MKILDAARWAPSAGNSQPWHFVVVRKKETIEAMVKAVRDSLDQIIPHAPDDKTKRDLKGIETATMCSLKKHL